MSKNIKLASLSVAVVAALLGAYWGGYQTASIAEPTTDIAHVASEAPILAQTTQPQVSGEQTAPQEVANNLVDVDPATIDWDAIGERYHLTAGGGIDPMLRGWGDLGGFTEKEVAAYNKLHVLPFNQKVDEVCYDRDTGMPHVGDNGITETCDAIMEFPDHEYADLPLDELLALSEADAAASVFASRKAEDMPTKIGMALQAVALSEKSGPLLELLERNFRGVTVSGRPKEEIANDLFNSLVFEKVADVLGDPRAKPHLMEPFLEDALEDPNEYQKALDHIEKAVSETLTYMSEIQRSSTGSTHIWELTNG
jgi:hypothetical protein